MSIQSDIAGNGTGNGNRVVLYASSQYFPDNAAVSIRTAAHVKALVRSNAQVTILTSKRSRTFKCNGFKLETVALAPPSNKSRLFVRFCREILFGTALGLRIWTGSPGQTVVITSPPFFMTVICAFFSKLRNAEYYLDIRDRYPDILFGLGVFKPDSLMGCLLRKLENRAYLGAKKVMTVTEGLVSAISRECAVEPALVRNGFDEDLFRPAAEKYETFTLVCHGNFGRLFNVDFFAEFARRLNSRCEGYRIVVVGSGSKLEQLKHMKLPRVEVLDALPQAEVAEIVSKAHLGFSFQLDNLATTNYFQVRCYEFIGAGLPCILSPMTEAGRVVDCFNMGHVFGIDEVDKAVNQTAELIRSDTAYPLLVENVLKKRPAFARSVQANSFADIILS